MPKVTVSQNNQLNTTKAVLKPNAPIATKLLSKQPSKVLVSPVDNPAVVIQPQKEQKVDSLYVRGIPGVDGRTIISNAGPPSNSFGLDGDYYIDKLTYEFYGPKILGNWGAGTPLITAGKNQIIKTNIQLTAYKVVTTDEQGFLINADASITMHANKVIGIILNSPTAQDSGVVATEGDITNFGWNWIPDRPIFLGLDGDITQDPNLPGISFSQQLGYAKSINTIMLKLSLAIVLLGK